MIDLGGASRRRRTRTAFAWLGLFAASGWACAACADAYGSGDDGSDAGPGGDAAGSETTTPIDGGDAGPFGAPEVVARDLMNPLEIACDSEAAYVAVQAADGNVLYRVARGVPPVVVAKQINGRYPAVDKERVYWVAGDPRNGTSFVHATPKGGGTSASLYTDNSGSAALSWLTVEGGELAFSSSNAGGRIFRGPTSGLGSGSQVAFGEGSVAGLAIAGAYVYWLPVLGDYVKRSASMDAGPPETFAITKSATSIAIANDDVFFTSDDGRLRALQTSTPGATPRIVASSLGVPRHLVVTQARAFWVDIGNGSVSTLALAGGMPVVIASGPGHENLAVCGNALWMTNPTLGQVLRLEVP